MEVVVARAGMMRPAMSLACAAPAAVTMPFADSEPQNRVA